jgi:hypothetical protein
MTNARAEHSLSVEHSHTPEKPPPAAFWGVAEEQRVAELLQDTSASLGCLDDLASPDTGEQIDRRLAEENSDLVGAQDPPFPVANDDPRLSGFLTALPAGPGAALALAAWLEERGDARAAVVRELAEAKCVVPEGVLCRRFLTPMACGRWWHIHRKLGRVAATVYVGTPLHRSLREGCGGHIMAPRPRAGWTPETLQAAFEHCRRELICALFATSREQLTVRLAVLHDPSLERVLQLLGRYSCEAVPALCELRSSDHARFQTVVRLLWADIDLHHLGYAVMDALEPDWRQVLSALVGLPCPEAGAARQQRT